MPRWPTGTKGWLTLTLAVRNVKNISYSRSAISRRSSLVPEIEVHPRKHFGHRPQPLSLLQRRHVLAPPLPGVRALSQKSETRISAIADLAGKGKRKKKALLLFLLAGRHHNNSAALEKKFRRPRPRSWPGSANAGVA